MATIIRSISFQNFYNYFGSFEQNTYRFKEGINIVNADNNMGKSKFYNGILWLLQNKIYDSELKRMISDTSIPRLDLSYFQNKIASKRAINNDNTFDVGVKVVFSENDSNYSVSKVMQFRKNGGNWKTNEKLEVEQTIDNRTIPISDIEDKNKIIRKIIPVELMNYALLQGESMEKLVDLSSRDGLSSTIEALAGIKNLIDICELSKDMSTRAKNLCKTKEKETDANDGNKDKLLKEQDELENRIESTEKKIETYKSELSKAKEKRENLEALQLNAGNREKFRGEQKRLLSEISTLKEQKKDKEKNITTMLFSDNSPWLLMDLKDHISLFDQRRQNLTSEIATQKAMDNPIKLPENSPDIPSLQRMLRTEICEVCGRPAPKGSEHWIHIEKVMKRPLSPEHKSKNDFSSFYSNIQTTVGSFFLSIPKISESIQKYRDSIDEIDDLIKQKQEEYETVQTEFLNAGGSESSSETTDKNNLAEYRLAEKTINDTEEKIKNARKLIDHTWEVRLRQIEEELKKNNNSTEITKYRDFKDTMCCVESIFVNSRERIFDDILKQLEINASNKYRGLTAGNQVAGGERLVFRKQEDNTVQVSIRSDNNELTGLGTGAQRMKQLSIIMAIISSKIGNKQFDYPFISDAPFSEFGDNFMYNFCQIAPPVFSQSIILIKDLYNPNAENLLNDKGNKILEKMKNGDIPGTFYVNIADEFIDANNFITKNKCYKD